jgi:capsular polysaccharide transport system permease protein
MLQLDQNSESFAVTIHTQLRVLHALMLRGIRSRFFGNGLGFLIASVGWPLGHMVLLVIIYSVTGRTVPIGDSAPLFFATGLAPVMAFNYISRWTMLGIMLDRSLLAYPIVKILDLLFARVLVEVLGAFLTVVSLILILLAIHADPMPRNFVQASYAYGAALLLGAGMGVLNGVIGMAFRAWFTGYTIVIIVVYMSSGILFIPDALPELPRYLLSFSPVVQAVEWMRSAYYPGYGSLILDKGYLLAWGIGTIFLGLLLERFVRGQALRT